MRPAGRPLAPTSSLPPLRQLDNLDESQLSSALNNLFAIYCPVSVPTSAIYDAFKPFKLLNHLAPATDSGYNSGYASEDEDEKESAADKDVALLRADEFERSFAMRWLERFIACAAEEDPRPACFLSDESQQSALEKAADLLTALLSPDSGDDESNADEDDGFCRHFSFLIPGQQSISVRLNDGLAGADHTDVGLQTWGASIVLCRMLCENPGQFEVSKANLGVSPKIVELGAGTGLVSLVLGQLLPRLGVDKAVVVATDYHPTVIANLKGNIQANLPAASSVQACALDWGQPELEASWPLGETPADLIIATDVVYDPEHATMLYDCASTILAPRGTFWLLQTVRPNGRHGDVADTVESVFSKESGPLRILHSERLEKQDGVGRADEGYYRLFKIGQV
ncbi:hypothetical protein OQA88_5356 [Cercophora sp. LCS_1]